MEPFPILITDERGTVLRANRSAARAFGPCVGRQCGALVGVRDRHGGLACTETCARELSMAGDGVNETRGTVLGEDARVLCSALGRGIAVVVMREAGEKRLRTRLSRREVDVVSRVARGLTMREVAKELGIAATTVRSHLDHAREKLGATTLADLVARAMACGLGELG